MPAHPRATARSPIQTDPLLAELSTRHRRLVWPLVALFLAWYLLLMVLAGFAPGPLSHAVGAHLNLAWLLALSQFPMTFLVAWCYSRAARHHLDPLAARLRADRAALLEAEAASAKEVPVWAEAVSRSPSSSS
jgi:uncharacterized membrane protein (DUF485 family)